MAEAVGRRLKSLSGNRQVLCVTHQPQIARFADHHFVVDKFFERGRTTVKIKNLSGEERAGELARMISGNSENATALDAARWLLKDAAIKESSSTPQKKKNQRD